MENHMPASPAAPVAPEAGVERKVAIKTYPLTFTGTGWQYFRVWGVNLLLMVLTLGIFTPWARRRTAVYFFGHSVVARSPLEFTASIKRMVIGFFVFLALYFIFRRAINSQSNAMVAIALITLAVAIPFLWGSSRRFRVTATRWRGLRLRFGTSWSEIYWSSWPVFLAAGLWFLVYVGMDMIDAFTAPSLLEETRPRTWLGWTRGKWALVAGGLLVTWLCAVRVLYNYQRLMVERTYIGIERGVFRARYLDFVKIWLVTTLIAVLGWGALLGGLHAFVSDGAGFSSVFAPDDWDGAAPDAQDDGYWYWEDGDSDDGAVADDWAVPPMEYDEGTADDDQAWADLDTMVALMVALVIALWVAVLGVFQVAWAYREAKQHRLVWSSTGVSDVARFRSTLSVPGYIWLCMQNWLLTMVTLGFYRPFARVREYRARWDSTTVHIRGGVSQIKSLLVIQQEGGAFADAIADFAGFDIVA